MKALLATLAAVVVVGCSDTAAPVTYSITVFNQVGGDACPAAVRIDSGTTFCCIRGGDSMRIPAHEGANILYLRFSARNDVPMVAFDTINLTPSRPHVTRSVNCTQ